jgi:uncharacterized protein (TIGR02145 family)
MKRFLLINLVIVSLLIIIMVACKNEDETDAPNFTKGTVVDIDGNVYQTIKIGTQEWMAENLKVKHYRNNVDIPNVKAYTAWYNLSTGAYCCYDNDTTNIAAYGLLYNWYAATDSQNICPVGWHLPSTAEWLTLIKYLGGDENVGIGSQNEVGGKMKETGFAHWLSPNTGATNVSGFTGLPGGSREYGTYYVKGEDGYWWSSTEFTDYSLHGGTFFNLEYDDNLIYSFYGSKNDGNSIRCIKD